MRTAIDLILRNNTFLINKDDVDTAQIESRGASVGITDKILTRVVNGNGLPVRTDIMAPNGRIIPSVRDRDANGISINEGTMDPSSPDFQFTDIAADTSTMLSTYLSGSAQVTHYDFDSGATVTNAGTYDLIDSISPAISTDGMAPDIVPVVPANQNKHSTTVQHRFGNKKGMLFSPSDTDGSAFAYKFGDTGLPVIEGYGFVAIKVQNHSLTPVEEFGLIKQGNSDLITRRGDSRWTVSSSLSLFTGTIGAPSNIGDVTLLLSAINDGERRFSAFDDLGNTARSENVIAADDQQRSQISIDTIFEDVAFDANDNGITVMSLTVVSDPLLDFGDINNMLRIKDALLLL